MPYRRLPKTDQARIRSLETFIDEASKYYHDLPVDANVFADAKREVQQFKLLVTHYGKAYENQIEANKKHVDLAKNARMYVSHFIQVLNMCVMRNEIKKELKVLYKLDPEDNNVPDLTSERGLLEWGNNIIVGESERIRLGGFQLYNPTISKVKVHYNLFREYKETQKNYQRITEHHLSKVVECRDRIDEIIKQIWDTIEELYKDLPPYSKLQACKTYGLIYYYRRGERELRPEDDHPTASTEQSL